MEAAVSYPADWVIGTKVAHSRQSPGLVPMMVLVPEQQHAAALGSARLEALYEEAMQRFDAFCFWHGRPTRTVKGLREVAERLDAYGSPPAMRIASDIRAALVEAGG